MGGKSSQTTTQQSQTEPWQAAQPFLHGILNQITAKVPGAGGLTENEAVATSQLEQNAKAGNPYAGLIGDFATNLLQGGGANAQAGNIGSNLDTYRNQLTPFASGSMVGKNEALTNQLGVIGNDVQNRVNSMFAGAGRDLSGANLQTLARGIAEGTAPVIANQYNQDVANQLGAAGSLYGAGNTTAGLLSGLNQQGLANQGVGVGVAGAAQDAKNSSAKALLEAEAIRRGIPVQQLGLLAQIGIPIAGLGQQSQGTSNTTKQMSGVEQFMGIASGIGSLMPKFPISFG